MRFRFGWIVLASAIAVALLIVVLKQGSSTAVNIDGKMLRIYCAAGIREPLQEIIDRYEQEYDVQFETSYEGSGKLLSDIRAAGAGDLFLAADVAYCEDAKKFDLVEEIVPVAFQHPCIVTRVGEEAKAQSLDDLLQADLRISLADPKVAAIGRVAQAAIADQTRDGVPLWQALFDKAVVTRQTVNEVANDVKGGAVDAGIVWNSTAVQYEELSIIEVPEFQQHKTQITLAVLKSAADPTRALHFLRYLTARDRGLVDFARHGYEVVDGDQWADTPELRLFTGGLMHPAIQVTIRDFEAREGVRILQTPNGCGILVAQIKAGEHPDAYFACDTSFMSRVQDVFPKWYDLSGTEMVLVVNRDAQSKLNLASLDDLRTESLKLGLCNPQHSALGELTENLLRRHGSWDEVKEKVVDWQTTADRLVEAVVIGGIDAAIVYRANTTRQAGKLHVIDLNDPTANAIQPIAVAADSTYPWLTARLVDRLRSDDSRRQFEAAGFRWVGDTAP